MFAAYQSPYDSPQFDYINIILRKAHFMRPLASSSYCRPFLSITFTNIALIYVYQSVCKNKFCISFVLAAQEQKQLPFYTLKYKF